MKGRIITLAIGLALASAGSAGATAFAPHVLCGASCGSLSATNGAGTLRLTGDGTSYGAVGSGTVAIKDLSNNGRVDFSVWGYRSSWKKDGWTFFSGTNMSYFVSTTSWKLKIHGKGGITSSTTAKGYGYIQGSGRWSHDGQSARSWPAAGQSFTLSS